MSTESILNSRCDSKCELCSSDTDLSVYDIPPDSDGSHEQCIMTCSTCLSQLDDHHNMDANHWRCLNDSMWSPVPAVQVIAWRQLKNLISSGEIWAQDLLDMLYLEEETLKWAESTSKEGSEYEAPTLDCNGTSLQAGDSVTIIKDLNVKGANFTAKRGTAVRSISLTNNPEQIEGRVNGQRIVLLSCYLKKSS